MSLFPAKCHPILVIDPNARSTSVTTFETFQPIARRDQQIVESGGHVEGLEFPLGPAPDVAW